MNQTLPIKHWVRMGREVLFPPAPTVAEAVIDEAQLEAERAWEARYGAFAPLVEGADILDLDRSDGAVLERLLTVGRARSAIGFALDPRKGSNAAPGMNEAAGEGALPHLLLDAEILDAMEARRFDLILCSGLDAVTPHDEIEGRLARLYDLLKSGGEALLTVRCADGVDFGPGAPGYGYLTPTGWSVLFLRAGFEIDEARGVWRAPEAQARLDAVLPTAGEDERALGEISLRLYRPWEAREIQALGEPHRPRGRKAR